MDRQPHTLPISECLKALNTSHHGLDSQEVSIRLKQYGYNVLKENKLSKLKLLLRQFHNFLIYTLMTASVVSTILGEWTDFVVINAIILINGLLGFWQELKAEASIAALKKLTESHHKVVRDGHILSIASSELVPGDYLIIHEGEVVTADIRLTDTAGLMVDESSMTGESTPMIKNHADILTQEALPYELTNMLLAGTTVVRGSGQGVVTHTGSNTYLASIAKQSQEASQLTPLTKALHLFGKRLVIMLLTLFCTLGIIGYLQQRSFVDMAYILLAMLVSTVPEGLPIVITLVMVIGALLLSKKKVFIRHLPSVETLGSATVIASDKTGTITEGKLIVKEVYTQDSDKLKLIASLCNDSHSGSGDPLDVALASFVESYDTFRHQYPRVWSHSFDSNLMLMATVHEINGQEELLVKGAYEALKTRANNPEDFPILEQKLHLFLEQGLRVLAFGYGDWGSQDPSHWNIRLIGLIGFLDPPKKGVKEAVLFAKKAGIRVVMITGDHPKTAQTIGREVGIWTPSDDILTGKELDTLPDEQLLKAIKKTTIFARTLPDHKYRIVKLLQSAREIVAVTGDGVNDVPALKRADIGIAMGSGTDAAKSASKMVISDNDLQAITTAVTSGRVIADNIRKVIYYLMSTSFQEIVIISLAILQGLPLPLSAIHILWINIVTAGVQDKTFAFAKGEYNVMNRKPRKPEQQFFDVRQILNIFVFGCTGILCFLLYCYLREFYDSQMTSTIIFCCVVLSQWANGIQAQKESEPFFKNIKKSLTINPYIFLGIAIGVALQCLAIYVLPQFFRVSPMTLQTWKYPLFLFCVAFIVVEIRKWIEFFLRKI